MAKIQQMNIRRKDLSIIAEDNNETQEQVNSNMFD